MSYSKSWLLCLLAIPAGGIGGFVGGTDHGEAGETPPGPNSPLTAIDKAAPLRDFSAADGGGKKPSFTELSLRILTAAKTADRRGLRQLKKEIGDARYGTDPGYYLASWAIRDTYRARFPGSIASEEIGPSSRGSFFLEWGGRDLQAAFDAAMVAEPANHRMFMLQNAFTNGSWRDPQLALRLLRSIPDPILRDQVALKPIVESLEKDPALYKELAAEFPLLQESIYDYAFASLAKKDPPRALAELENVPKPYRHKAQTSLLANWGSKDHAAALEWARANKVSLPPSIFHSWAAADPIPALEAALSGEFVQNYYSGGLDTIVAMATEKNSANRETVASWLAELDDPPLRARLSIGLLHGDDPPSEALLEAGRLVADDPNRHRDSFQTLEQFTNRIKDPQERRDWIRSLSPPASRSLMSTQAGRWLKEDATAFGSYVDSLPSARAQASFLRGALNHQNSQQHHPNLRAWAENHLGADALKQFEGKQP